MPDDLDLSGQSAPQSLSDADADLRQQREGMATMPPLERMSGIQFANRTPQPQPVAPTPPAPASAPSQTSYSTPNAWQMMKSWTPPAPPTPVLPAWPPPQPSAPPVQAPAAQPTASKSLSIPGLPDIPATPPQSTPAIPGLETPSAPGGNSSQQQGGTVPDGAHNVVSAGSTPTPATPPIPGLDSPAAADPNVPRGTPKPFAPTEQPFRANTDGSVEFDPNRLQDGLIGALQTGAITPGKFKELSPKAEAAQQALAEQQKLVESNPIAAKIKAGVLGAGRGAAFLAGAPAGAEGGAAIGAMIPGLDATGIPEIAGAAIGSAITGGAAAWGYDKIVKQLAKYSDTVKSFVDASEMHPNYDAAGNLVSFAAGLPKAATDLAAKGLSSLAGEGEGIVAKGLKGAADAYTKGSPGVIRSAQNLAEDWQNRVAQGASPLTASAATAARVGGFAGANVAMDTAIKTASHAMGLGDGQTLSGAAQSAVIGGMLAGHGIAGENIGKDEGADIMTRGMIREEAGLSRRDAMSVAEIAAKFPNADGVEVHALSRPLSDKETEFYNAAAAQLKAALNRGENLGPGMTVAGKQMLTAGQPYGNTSAVVTPAADPSAPAPQSPPSAIRPALQTPSQSSPLAPGLPGSLSPSSPSVVSPASGTAGSSLANTPAAPGGQAPTAAGSAAPGVVPASTTGQTPPAEAQPPAASEANPQGVVASPEATGAPVAPQTSSPAAEPQQPSGVVEQPAKAAGELSSAPSGENGAAGQPLATPESGVAPAEGDNAARISELEQKVADSTALQEQAKREGNGMATALHGKEVADAQNELNVLRAQKPAPVATEPSPGPRVQPEAPATPESPPAKPEVATPAQPRHPLHIPGLPDLPAAPAEKAPLSAPAKRIQGIANAVLRTHTESLKALGHPNALEVGETRASSGLETDAQSERIRIDPEKLATATSKMEPQQQLKFIKRAIAEEVIHVGTVKYAKESQEQREKLLGLVKDKDLMAQTRTAYGGAAFDKLDDFAKAAEAARVLIQGPGKVTEASYKWLKDFLKWLTAKLKKLSPEMREVMDGIKRKLGQYESSPPAEVEPRPEGKGAEESAVAERTAADVSPKADAAPVKAVKSPTWADAMRESLKEAEAVAEHLKREKELPYSQFNFELWMRSKGYDPEEISGELQELEKGNKTDAYAEWKAGVDQAEEGAPVKTEPTKKGSTQLTLPPAEAKPFQAFAKSIPDAEIYKPETQDKPGGYGRELEPHVTTLWGLKGEGDQPNAVQKALAGHGPITLTLGKLSKFSSPDSPYDVLKVDVDSPQIRAANEALKTLPHESTHPEYHPHLTIAYMNKGEADKYVGDTRFEGKTITIPSVTHSSAERVKTDIPLTGSAGPAKDIKEPAEAATDIKEQVQAAQTGENPRSPKEIKEELISRLKQAIMKRGKAKTVTIQIPGDGTFTLMNTNDALADVLRRVQKMPVKLTPFGPPSLPTGSGRNDAQILAEHAREQIGGRDAAIEWLRENSAGAPPKEKAVNEAAIALLKKQGGDDPLAAANPSDQLLSAIRMRDGELFSAPTHLQAMELAQAKHPDVFDENGPPFDEGFITGDGRYLDRAEALQHARATGQVRDGEGALPTNPRSLSSKGLNKKEPEPAIVNKLRDAYERVQQDRKMNPWGFRDVHISDVLKEAGLPLEDGKKLVQSLRGKGVQVTGGDWSLATDEQKAAGLEAFDRPHGKDVMMHFDDAPLGAASPEDAKREPTAWTPERGGALYHGTNAPPFDSFKGSALAGGTEYFATDPRHAEEFAGALPGASLHGKAPGEARVIHADAKPGRVKALDSDPVFHEELMNGDVDKYLAQEAQKARGEGYRYLSHDHPSTKGEDFKAIVSLYPKEDIAIRGEKTLADAKRERSLNLIASKRPLRPEERAELDRIQGKPYEEPNEQSRTAADVDSALARLSEPGSGSGSLLEAAADDIGRNAGAIEAEAGEQLGAANPIHSEAAELRQQLRGALSKAHVNVADDFMAGDQEQVRRDMVQVVKEALPLAERGRFIGAITKALARPSLLRGDPAVMYRNAFRVMRTIANRATEVYKSGLVSEVKKIVNRAIDSPSVDVIYKAFIRKAMDGLREATPMAATVANQKATQDYIDKLRASGEEVSAELLSIVSDAGHMPLAGMPVEALEKLRDKVALLEKLGRDNVKRRAIAWEREKSERVAEMAKAEARPLEDNPVLKAQPGEKLAPMQRVGNYLNRGRNWFQTEEFAHAPMDELYDLLDGGRGKYTGWATRNIRGTIDLAYNRERAEFQPVMDEAKRIAKQNKLTDLDHEKIGAHAILQMEGGRDRLREMGVTDETMTKAATLTPEQKELYDYMRTAMDGMLPRIQETKRLLDNEPVIPVKNYFPLMRDWVEYAKTDVSAPGEVTFDEDATGRQLFNDLSGGQQLSTKATQGFTMARQKGAKTAVKVNAMDVFERHIADALHYIHTQPDLRMLGQIARSDTFASKYGKLGQQIVLDHLDTVARQGGVNRFQRIKFLDAIRTNTSRAAVGFRLASNFVHLSQIPYSAYHAGGAQWWARGLRAVFSDAGQRFIAEHAPETLERSGGEPAQAEVENRSSIAHAGFAIARNIDRLNAQATFMGRYLHEMAKKGFSQDQALEMPVDEAAQKEALVRMRRAVASPLYKDVPQALSRGKGYGGNVSIARAVNQFRNIFLDNWSAIRHDLFRGGIGDAVQRGLSGDNATKFATVALITLASIALETGIKFGLKHLIKSGEEVVTGKEDQPDKKTIVDEFEHHLINRVPFLGQALSAALYGETGVPAIDAAVTPLKEAGIAAKAKKEGTQTYHGEKALAALATVLGVPGSGQLSELAIQKPEAAGKEANTQQLAKEHKAEVKQQKPQMNAWQIMKARAA